MKALKDMLNTQDGQWSYNTNSVTLNEKTGTNCPFKPAQYEKILELTVPLRRHSMRFMHTERTHAKLRAALARKAASAAGEWIVIDCSRINLYWIW